MPRNLPRLLLPSFRIRQLCFCLAVLLLAGGLIARPAQSAELRIAVASNFLPTLLQLADEYQRIQDQDSLQISAGSSGALYAQLQHAAPFDIFLSADQLRPQLLEEQQRILPGSRFTYARGVLALWSADPSLVDAEGAVLNSERYHYLALASPDNAPYGDAARQLLQSKGLWHPLEQEQRLIRGASVRQTLFQVASGAAPLGFIALSQAQHPHIRGQGSLWIPDSQLYAPIIQQGVILKNTAHPQAAQRFVLWLQSTRARQLIAGAGYAASGPVLVQGEQSEANRPQTSRTETLSEERRPDAQ